MDLNDEELVRGKRALGGLTPMDRGPGDATRAQWTGATASRRRSTTAQRGGEAARPARQDAERGLPAPRCDVAIDLAERTVDHPALVAIAGAAHPTALVPARPSTATPEQQARSCASASGWPSMASTDRARTAPRATCCSGARRGSAGSGRERRSRHAGETGLGCRPPPRCSPSTRARSQSRVRPARARRTPARR